MKLIRVPGTLRFVFEKNLWTQHEVAMSGGVNPKTGELEYYPKRIGTFNEPFQYKIRGESGDRENRNYWVRGTNKKGKIVTIAPNAKYFVRNDPFVTR